jgi:serine protease AprX
MRPNTSSPVLPCVSSPEANVMTWSLSHTATPHGRRRGLSFALVLALATVTVLGLAHVPVASAGATLDGKLSAWKDGGSPEVRHQRVIIRAAKRSYLKVAADLWLRGRRVEATAPSLGLMTVVVNHRDLGALLGRADVLGISSDARVVPTLPGIAAGSEPAVNLPAAPDQVAEWRGPWQDGHLASTLGTDTLVLDGRPITGAGVGVAVIDSGIAPSRDYHVAAFVDFVAGHTRPYDDFGHGTHVAGLIASSGAQSNGFYRGVAPGARLIGLKVLDANGSGRTSDVIAALAYVVANRERLGIHVVNLSLGHVIDEPAVSDPLVITVEAAVRAGLVVVVSAGNLGSNPVTGEVGYAGVTSPGNAPSAITVGALNTQHTLTRTDDVVTHYSSRGPTWYDGLAKPDLVAPGHRLTSNATPASTLSVALGDRYTRATGTTGYLRLSGTSMAAAVTSGAVALILDAHRRTETATALTPNTVKAQLQFTALDVAGADSLAQGAGSLNPAGAATLAAAIDPAAPLGTCWVTTPTSPLTTIGGETLSWSQRLVWGDTAIAGDLIYTNEPAWAQRLVWGDRLVWADRLVWGDAVVWGDDLP